MKKWVMIIDVAKCHNCNNCFMACKDEHVDNDWTPVSRPQPRHGHRWRDIARTDRGQYPLIDIVYRPGNCMMCENAPCIDAGSGAVIRRDDGIVLIVNEMAKGRRDLVEACPYGAIWWNDAENLPQKCTFCAHLLDQGWTDTRCSQVCPTGATVFRFLDNIELEALIREEGLECYRDDLGTRPRVIYKNLYRFTKHFIAGSLIYGDECCEGAQVTVAGETGRESAVCSNGYGDFRADGLVPDAYTVTISYPGCTDIVRKVTLEESCHLGEFTLG